MTKKLDIIETKAFLKSLSDIVHKGQDEQELRDDIIELIRKDPRARDVIPGSGGIRKLRHAMQGKGKSGGYRIIYYFYNEQHPAYLLTIYSKNIVVDMTQKEIAAYAKVIKQIKQTFK